MISRKDAEEIVGLKNYTEWDRQTDGDSTAITSAHYMCDIEDCKMYAILEETLREGYDPMAAYWVTAEDPDGYLHDSECGEFRIKDDRLELYQVWQDSQRGEVTVIIGSWEIKD